MSAIPFLESVMGENVPTQLAVTFANAPLDIIHPQMAPGVQVSKKNKNANVDMVDMEMQRKNL